MLNSQSLLIAWLIISTAVLWSMSQEMDDPCRYANGTAKRCEPDDVGSFGLFVMPIVNSTCGNNPSTPFCIRHSDLSIMSCDNYCSPGSHPPEHMTDLSEETWWQSEIGVQSPVTINITMNALVQIQTISFTYISLKPHSFYIRKTRSSNHPPEIFHYFSTDCLNKYNIDPNLNAQNDISVLCQDITDDTSLIRFSTLQNRPSATGDISDGYSSSLYDFITATSIEVVLDGLSNLTNTNESDRYYAIANLAIIGVCQCNGHASECVDDGDGGKMCICQHNTAGNNCERCKDFYNDAPWSINNDCRECQCNNRSESCEYDEVIKGGRCINCSYPTRGPHCDECFENHYPSPYLPVNSTNYCQPCECHEPGVVDGDIDCLREANGSMVVGQCTCKDHVDGRTCDTCEDGYYNLSNPDGCQECECNLYLSQSSICDKVTGDCTCKPNAVGIKCSTCQDGYYMSGNGCSPCDCNIGGALSTSCHRDTGQCDCRSGITGRTCSDIIDGYYLPYLDHYTYEAEDGKGLFNVVYQPAAGDGLHHTGAGHAVITDHVNLINFGIFTPPISGLYDFIIRYDLLDPFSLNSAVLFVDIGTGAGQGPPTLCQEPMIDTALHYDDWGSGIGTSVGSTLCLRGGRSYNITLNGFNSTELHLSVDSLVIMMRRGEGLTALTIPSLSSQYDSCIDTFKSLASRNNISSCYDTLFIVFSELYNGTLGCGCGIGSANVSSCDVYGGQCSCKDGVAGRSCGQCMSGYYDISSIGCQSCNCFTAGSVHGYCNRTFGQCRCLSGVIGRTCDSCAVGYYNLTSGVGCQNCLCDAVGSALLQCNNDGSCSCNVGFDGPKCNKCLPQLYDFPNCIDCSCDVVGSLSDACINDNGQCYCRKHTTGRTCQTCINGTFNLHSSNPDGCQPCFCSGQSASCVSASGYVSSSVTSLFLTPSSLDGWTFHDGMAILNQSSLQAIDDGGLRVITSSGSAYMMAPHKYLGNKLSSYGRFLRLNVTLHQPYYISTGHDISINNSNGDHLYGHFIADSISGSGSHILSVHFHESTSFNTSMITSYHLQSILVDLTSLQLFINGSFDISSIELETASMADGNPMDQTTLRVEECVCPLNYTGLSCESCSDGYTRDVDGRCILCNCSGHSITCDKHNGTCMGCSGNTTGRNCERCQDGYYSNPMMGGACTPCPCPLTTRPGQYSDTCIHNGSIVICNDCPEGHAGFQCESCLHSFYGDPDGSKSGGSTPCTSCLCNSNIDMSDMNACNFTTGICINCGYNTTGDQCHLCLPGYYGNAIGGSNCTECGCYPNGSIDDSCNDIGQCNCHSNAAGLKCDECLSLYYRSHVGCEMCQCHVDGSLHLQCNDITGQCQCKPYVTGRSCDMCFHGYYNMTEHGCQDCECSFGSSSLQCHENGTCPCNEGVIGDKCDSCIDNYYPNSSICQRCPSCYFDIQDDAHILDGHHMMTVHDVNSKARLNVPENTFNLRLTHAMNVIIALTQSANQLNLSHGQLHSDINDLHDFVNILNNYNISQLSDALRSAQIAARPSITLSAFITDEMADISNMLYGSLYILNSINGTILPLVNQYANTIAGNTAIGRVNRSSAISYRDVLMNLTNNIMIDSVRSLNLSSLSIEYALRLASNYTDNQYRMSALANITRDIEDSYMRLSTTLRSLNVTILMEDVLLDMIDDNITDILDYIDSIDKLNLTDQYRLLYNEHLSLSELYANLSQSFSGLNHTIEMIRFQYNTLNESVNSTIERINDYYNQLINGYRDGRDAVNSSDMCISRGQDVLNILTTFNSSITELQSQVISGLNAIDGIRGVANVASEAVSNATIYLDDVISDLMKGKPKALTAQMDTDNLEIISEAIKLNSSELLNNSQSLVNASESSLNDLHGRISSINETSALMDDVINDVNDTDERLTIASNDPQLNATAISANATDMVNDLMMVLSSTPVPDPSLISDIEMFINSVDIEISSYDIYNVTVALQDKLTNNLIPQITRLNEEYESIEREANRLRVILNSLPSVTCT